VGVARRQSIDVFVSSTPYILVADTGGLVRRGANLGITQG